MEEAIELFESVSLVLPQDPDVPLPLRHLATFHWAITDPSGRSIVVEYLQAPCFL